MKRMIRPSLALTSRKHGLESFLELSAKLRAREKRPTSSAMIRESRIAPGQSPSTILMASPSAIAVLPTPGSPIRTGLFLVRRESTCMQRRISSSRPITGSILPADAASIEIDRILGEGFVVAFRAGVGDVLDPGTLSDRGDRGTNLLRIGSTVDEHLLRIAIDPGKTQKQMFAGDVLVTHGLRGSFRIGEHLLQGGAALGRPALHDGHAVQFGFRHREDSPVVSSRLAQYRCRDAVVVFEKGDQKMEGADLSVFGSDRASLSCGKRFLCERGESFECHVMSSFRAMIGP